MSRFLLLSLIACVACGSTDDDAGETNAGSTVASCKQKYSPAAGYGWEDDLRIATSPPGDAAPPPAPDPLDETIAECQAAGEPPSVCDASAVMTHDAAICVAELLGLAPGIAGLKAGIVFHHTERRIVWNVQNTLYSEPGGSEGGESLRIDAITGASLRLGEWVSIP